MRRVLALLGVISACAVAEARPGRNTSQVSICGVSLRIPAGWEVRSRPPEPGALCAAEILPRALAASDADSVPRYVLTVARERRSFEDAAEAAGFRKGDSGWVVLGRQGTESPAEESPSPQGRMLRGTALIGWSGSGDRYQGLADNPRAVISHGEHTLTFTGGPETDLVLDEIVRSLSWRGRW